MSAFEAEANSATKAQLVRSLGFWASTGIVIGVTIGSGIFRTPAGIASRVPNPALMLSIWAFGGLITICGTLTLAELGGLFPDTGGLYVYIREAWGRLPAFLFGWSQLVLIRAAALGAISTVFAEYFLRSIGFNPDVYPASVHWIAAAAIGFATLVNIRGVQFGAAVVGGATVGKYGSLAVLVIASMLLGGSRGGSFQHFTATGTVNPGLFGLALISVLWAYDGWADLSFIGGEVTNPQRNLPRALIFGTLCVLVIYLLANVAYLYMNPIQQVAKSRLIAADVMFALFGRLGVALVSVTVMISTFGAVNASMLTSPRIFFAQADDRLFFKSIARVHPRYHTPYVAIGMTGALGILFVLTRTFEQLSDTFVLAMWPFYALSVAAVYRLRRSRPEAIRPYRTPAYPVLPLVFIAGVGYIMVNAFVTEMLWSSIVFGIVLAGVPVYWFYFGRRPAAPGIEPRA
ncbi:MAG TPA: amino acid permease [Acidobacteriota bacterium]